MFLLLASIPSALALLNSVGAERHYKPGEVRKSREEKDGDNTLEVVTLVRPSWRYILCHLGGDTVLDKLEGRMSLLCHTVMLGG